MLDHKWLRKLLTKAKSKAPLWSDLVDVLTDASNKFSEHHLERLKTRSSLFEQGPEDLAIELRELGDDFAYGDITKDSLPLIIMQRKDEFNFKPSEYPLQSTLSREFTNVEVTWEPLYAPINVDAHPYGTDMVIESKFNDHTGYDKDDYFLTSRGLIRVVLNLSKSGMSEEELIAFEAHLRRVAYPLVPLHIVLEGQMYAFEFNLVEHSEFIEITRLSSSHRIALDESQESLTLSNCIETTVELIDGLRESAPAEMRVGPIGIDSVCLDYEAAITINPPPLNPQVNAFIHVAPYVVSFESVNITVQESI